MQNEKQTKGRKPDFKGYLDVAAWLNTEEDGTETIAVVLGSRAKLFPVKEDVVAAEIEAEDIYS